MELVFFRRGSTVGVVGAEGWPRSLGSVRGFVLMNHSPTSPSTYDKILPSTGSQSRKYVARGAAGRHPPRRRSRGKMPRYERESWAPTEATGGAGV